MASTIKVDEILDSQGNPHQMGKVLQIVEWSRQNGLVDATSSLLTTTSTSFVNIMSKSITTTQDNSKILILTYCSGYNGSLQRGSIRLLDVSSNQISSARYFPYDAGSVFTNHSFNMIDTPNVSAGTVLTYTVQGRSDNGGTVNFGYGDGGGGHNTSIILMEIGA